ncbi:MAG: 50S ribosomal protein L23 [Clostridium sp.]|uniref:50S ribosomal protein L23 n=1 Tax=Clostridium sp. TaxID=1506 RepID=UPI0029110F56|nr:50S ribosomal protein L23 [Clostridium sp.]MDU7338188.1 50S ribosomal protein L23 [Clostridium sp.]
MTAHEIVVRPIITEKSMSTISAKKYTFEVARNATKIDIARAIEELFKVKVAKVNTLHVRGHLRRQGRTQGYTAAWKKAVVALTEDSKPIEFFEGMM